MKAISAMQSELKIADQKGRITLGSRYAGRRFAVREDAKGTTVLTPVLVVPEKQSAPPVSPQEESFAALAALADNWDGRQSPAPAPALVHHAREVLALLQAGVVSRGHLWMAPHVGCNERGQIMLEWWHGLRSLTIFIRSEAQINYLKV